MIRFWNIKKRDIIKEWQCSKRWSKSYGFSLDQQFNKIYFNDGQVYFEISGKHYDELKSLFQKETQNEPR